ncbi:PREDICTED: ralBP1-associated Eps domain-containing protein 1 [Papilio xuthus]|uniref:RalBP1-associated Eps domain-containing protein 1 n=1 Tax=Papilio xuthus TaxID=66420 RepID=A0AAJ7EJQ3_PAPXU|nr:PREDICTED: ralBP1-associated Eps domain-containing protein 1 [Papilio xuthus]
MEDLNLTETEMRYFSDLFLCCDEESNGKIPILKATELFRSSNVPNNILSQIMDISVAPNNHASLKHMNRKQFYSALKLIAAHQTNMTLKPELLSTPLDLPLPRFTWALNSEANSDLIQLSNSPKEQYLPKRERNFGNLGAYEPIRLSSNLSDSDLPQALSHDTAEGLSTDSEIESETMSQRSGSCGRRVKTGSPWSTASESPTPTNSVAERVHPVWEHSATGRGVWPTNTAEEHTRLLGTEEESSDRHSSEEEGEGEAAGGAALWAVSEAQARHYAAQFTQLRPECGLLSGHTARMFFEKSRLSVTDLRKIWQLSDITKDGMLTLEEFSIAMHLIVLRRNNIPVPDVLPACLVPRVDSHFSQQAVTTDLVDLGSDMFSSGTSADFNFAPKPEPNDPYESIPAKKPEDRPPSLTPPKPEPQVNNKEWTKFVDDSPTLSVSSPGPKPVNFDFQKSAVERDPKIFHPVALRVTPDASALPAHGEGDMRASTSPRRDDFAHAFELASPKRLAAQPDPPQNGNNQEIKAIQRPQPKKPVKSAGVLPPPPAREPSVHADDGPQSLQYPPKKEPPPPPPPRPLRNHARSSSLDLNRFKGAPAPPPQPPPRMSPSATSPPARRLHNQRSEGEPAFPPDAFAPPPRDYEEEEGFGYIREDAPKMHGAFEVYRKPSRESSCEADPDVKSLQEQNAVLRRVCRALCAELADAQREREALRLRLEADTNTL